MHKKSELSYLEGKIFLWLDEAWDEYCCGNKSEFLEGKIYAYVECLEEILHSYGVSNKVLICLERQYGIR